jgi:hypothetical protein
MGKCCCIILVKFNPTNIRLNLTLVKSLVKIYPTINNISSANVNAHVAEVTVTSVIDENVVLRQVNS